MNADEYNRTKLERELIGFEHIDELMRMLPSILDHVAPTFSRRVSLFQRSIGLVEDGKLGPKTRVRLSEHRQLRQLEERGRKLRETVDNMRKRIANDPLQVGLSSYLVGSGLRLCASHLTWYGGEIRPIAIVWHNTDTGPGTARAMARRRVRRYGTSPDDRRASWHITIGTDGEAWLQVPLDREAWHAGGRNKKPLLINGVEMGHPNEHAIGIELEGDGLSFTEAQMFTAARVTDAINRRFKIRREAHVLHREVNKVKNCPQNWDIYLPAVLDAVYGDKHASL